MAVLVVYANKLGATGEIAERIAAGVRAAGQPADARPLVVAQGAGDLDDYQGFVMGSAAHSTYWLKDVATLFVRDNQELLAQRPVCLFSSGPLAADPPDARAVVLSRAVILPEDFGDWAQIRGWARWMAQEPAQLEASPQEGAAPRGTQRIAGGRRVGRPVAPSSMRRTLKLNSVGGTFVFLGLLALLMGAPLTLMLAWSISGALMVGAAAAALVGGLGVLMLVANWVVLGLSERTPAEREQSRRERDSYEAELELEPSLREP